MVASTKEDYIHDLRESFGYVEYTVFGLVLCMSAAIGVYHGFFSKKEKNNEEFLMGGRSMKAWPVALSIMCSFVSALTVLGNPVETYLYGTQYITIILCFLPVTVILQHVYAPVYFKLQLTSGYEYFELRFNTTVRRFLSSIHCIYLVFYMALVVYGPSLALNQVTGFDTLLSVALIFVICIFYSTLGGFRAVIWTDALQGVIMILAIVVVAIKGTIDVGGLGEIWQRLSDTGRLSFFRFDPDPRTRHSVFSVLIGGTLVYLTNMAGYQVSIRKTTFPACSNGVSDSWLTVTAAKNEAKTNRQMLSAVALYSKENSENYDGSTKNPFITRALWLNFVILSIIIFLCTYVGVVIFAYFYECDPIKAKLVETTDQIFPLFVMDSVGHIPGLPGLFVAGLTCASLSSVSSALNAMAAIVMEDYVLKIKPDMNDKMKFSLSRIISMVTGIISFAFIFIVRLMGDIFPAAVALLGMLVGPTFGTYSLGMMFPWANSLGALYGVICSYAISTVVALGSAIEGANGDLPDQRQSLSTEKCSDFFLDTSTIEYFNHSISPAATWKNRDDSAFVQISTTSYLYFPLLGTLLTIIFGLIFSWLVDQLGWDKDNRKPVNRDCISPPFIALWERLFPEQMNQIFSLSEKHTIINANANNNNAAVKSNLKV